MTLQMNERTARLAWWAFIVFGVFVVVAWLLTAPV